VANGGGKKIVGLSEQGDRVSRVETTFGYSLWHYLVGRRKTGHVVEMCCARL